MYTDKSLKWAEDMADDIYIKRWWLGKEEFNEYCKLTNDRRCNSSIEMGSNNQYFEWKFASMTIQERLDWQLDYYERKMARGDLRPDDQKLMNDILFWTFGFIAQAGIAVATQGTSVLTQIVANTATGGGTYLINTARSYSETDRNAEGYQSIKKLLQARKEFSNNPVDRVIINNTFERLIKLAEKFNKNLLAVIKPEFEEWQRSNTHTAHMQTHQIFEAVKKLVFDFTGAKSSPKVQNKPLLSEKAVRAIFIEVFGDVRKLLNDDIQKVVSKEIQNAVKKFINEYMDKFASISSDISSEKTDKSMGHEELLKNIQDITHIATNGMQLIGTLARAFGLKDKFVLHALSNIFPNTIQVMASAALAVLTGNPVAIGNLLNSLNSFLSSILATPNASDPLEVISKQIDSLAKFMQTNFERFHQKLDKILLGMDIIIPEIQRIASMLSNLIAYSRDFREENYLWLSEIYSQKFKQSKQWALDEGIFSLSGDEYKAYSKDIISWGTLEASNEVITGYTTNIYSDEAIVTQLNRGMLNSLGLLLNYAKNLRGYTLNLLGNHTEKKNIYTDPTHFTLFKENDILFGMLGQSQLVKVNLPVKYQNSLSFPCPSCPPIIIREDAAHDLISTILQNYIKDNNLQNVTISLLKKITESPPDVRIPDYEKYILRHPPINLKMWTDSLVTYTHFLRKLPLKIILDTELHSNPANDFSTALDKLISEGKKAQENIRGIANNGFMIYYMFSQYLQALGEVYKELRRIGNEYIRYDWLSPDYQKLPEKYQNDIEKHEKDIPKKISPDRTVPFFRHFSWHLRKYTERYIENFIKDRSKYKMNMDLTESYSKNQTFPISAYIYEELPENYPRKFHFVLPMLYLYETTENYQLLYPYVTYERAGVGEIEIFYWNKKSRVFKLKVYFIINNIYQSYFPQRRYLVLEADPLIDLRLYTIESYGYVTKLDDGTHKPKKPLFKLTATSISNDLIEKMKNFHNLHVLPKFRNGYFAKLKQQSNKMDSPLYRRLGQLDARALLLQSFVHMAYGYARQADTLLKHFKVITSTSLNANIQKLIDHSGLERDITITYGYNLPNDLEFLQLTPNNYIANVLSDSFHLYLYGYDKKLKELDLREMPYFKKQFDNSVLELHSQLNSNNNDGHLKKIISTQEALNLHNLIVEFNRYRLSPLLGFNQQDAPFSIYIQQMLIQCTVNQDDCFSKPRNEMVGFPSIDSLIAVAEITKAYFKNTNFTKEYAGESQGKNEDDFVKKDPQTENPKTESKKQQSAPQESSTNTENVEKNPHSGTDSSNTNCVCKDGMCICNEESDEFEYASYTGRKPLSIDLNMNDRAIEEYYSSDDQLISEEDLVQEDELKTMKTPQDRFVQSSSGTKIHPLIMAPYYWLLSTPKLAKIAINYGYSLMDAELYSFTQSSQLQLLAIPPRSQSEHIRSEETRTYKLPGINIPGWGGMPKRPLTNDMSSAGTLDVNGILMLLRLVIGLGQNYYYQSDTVITTQKIEERKLKWRCQALLRRWASIEFFLNYEADDESDNISHIRGVLMELRTDYLKIKRLESVKLSVIMEFETDTLAIEELIPLDQQILVQNYPFEEYCNTLMKFISNLPEAPYPQMTREFVNDSLQEFAKIQLEQTMSKILAEDLLEKYQELIGWVQQRHQARWKSFGCLLPDYRYLADKYIDRTYESVQKADLFKFWQSTPRVEPNLHMQLDNAVEDHTLPVVFNCIGGNRTE